MNTKVCALIFLFVSFQSILVNGTLNCVYTEGSSYTCELTINNPNGLDDFPEIAGTHADDLFDSYVETIQAVPINSISTNIPSIICEKFSETKTINLANIGIEIIGEKSFQGCTAVTIIRLDSNKIATVNELAFSENLNLEELYLGTNLISTMPLNVFNFLEKLKTLELSGNKITDPKWFGGLRKLQKLLLNNNEIEELAAGTFNSLNLLNTLTLGYNSITTIKSESFGSLSRLATIELQQNKINAIDAQFIDNTGVKKLDLTNNLCYSGNIIDQTADRATMKNDLKKCFENYINLYTTVAPSTTELSTSPKIDSSTSSQTISSTSPKTDSSTSSQTISSTSFPDSSTSSPDSSTSSPDSPTSSQSDSSTSSQTDSPTSSQSDSSTSSQTDSPTSSETEPPSTTPGNANEIMIGKCMLIIVFVINFLLI